MREAFVNINDIPTHIMAWGPWIEESFSGNEVVICITGNPGLPAYYTNFLSTVYETIGSDVPVWILSHAGHGDPPKSSIRKLPPLIGNENKYGLRGQVDHKVEFIRKYVPADVKIHLISHSIGSWMTLELLKIPEIQNKIQHCYLLFPTVERMATSDNGKFYLKYVAPNLTFLRLLAVFFAMLPRIIQTILVYVFFFFKSIPQHFIGTAIKTIAPKNVDRISFLANEEMAQVVVADYDTIRKNKHLITMHYGKTDGWVPLKYYQSLKEQIPDVDAEVNANGVAHAFMMDSAEHMGKLVGGWIIRYKRY